MKDIDYFKEGSGWNPEQEDQDATKEDAIYENVFGVGKPNPINWKPFLPEFEDQKSTAFCVTFSRLNCGEGVARRNNTELNFSDRYLGVISGTTMKGNSLKAVSEAFRKKGTVKEKECPWEPQWLANPWNYWEQINDISQINIVCKFFGGNYSRIHGSSAILDALGYSPVQIGIGVGSTYGNEIVTRPPRYNAYHAVALYHMDKNYYYIMDSLGRPYKKLTRDYPILWAYSFRDLPENWKTLNEMPLELVRKKKEKEVYAILYGKRFWVTPANMLNFFIQAGVVKSWESIKVVDEFEEPLGGIFGEITISGYIKKLRGEIK